MSNNDDDPNIQVSNGTCYSSAGEVLDASFIPCGNDAFGRQTCCGAGDNCLADNACFGFHGQGYGSYLTYMAGCTDPAYEADTCPQKKIDQPWIALTLCDDSDGEWAPCSQIDNPTTLQPGAYCSCTDAAQTTIQFSDAVSLSSLASLPGSTGESIQFFAGHAPTGTVTGGGGGGGVTTTVIQTTVDGSGSTGVVTQTLPGTTVTGTAAGTSDGSSATSSSSTGGGGGGGGSSSDSGSGESGQLNQGAKIGIGVGVGVGGVLLLALGIMLFLWHRRRRRQRRGPTTDNDMAGGAPGGGLLRKKTYNNTKEKTKANEVEGQPVAETEGTAVPPWTLRSELEGDVGTSQVPVVGAGTGLAAADKEKKSKVFKPYRKSPGVPEMGEDALLEAGGTEVGERVEIDGREIGRRGGIGPAM
ncbi:hypothetical protein F4778DRAFT_236088 [Xylariomycetidae sp. FL2044]|nr:hypothetical protein F4778DRAFT_236088 [Xylariomycetidae sp. FL2044]